MGRATAGVRGMKLKNADDAVVACDVVPPGAVMLFVSSSGHGKRTKLDLFHKQGRGGQGVRGMKITASRGRRGGRVHCVTDDDEILVFSSGGNIIRHGRQGDLVAGTRRHRCAGRPPRRRRDGRAPSPRCSRPTTPERTRSPMSPTSDRRLDPGRVLVVRRAGTSEAPPGSSGASAPAAPADPDVFTDDTVRDAGPGRSRSTDPIASPAPHRRGSRIGRRHRSRGHRPRRGAGRAHVAAQGQGEEAEPAGERTARRTRRERSGGSVSSS